MIKLNLAHQYRYVVLFATVVVKPIGFSVLGERTIVIFILRQLVCFISQAIANTLDILLVLVQALQYVEVFHVVKKPVTCQNEEVVVFDRGLILSSMVRKLVIRATLIWVIEFVLLLFCTEQYAVRGILIPILSHVHVPAIAKIQT